MKLLLLTIAALSLTLNTKSQVKFGAKAGLNLGNMRYAPFAAANDFSNSYKLKPGLNAGALVNIHLANKFSLQPEVLYSMEGSIANTNYEKVADRLNFINVPVMLQYKLSQRFFVELGPQAGFLVSAKKKVISVADLITEVPNDPAIDRPGQIKDIKSYYNNFVLSAAIGAGYHFNAKMGTNLRFAYGVTKLTKKDGTGNNRSYNFKSYNLQLNLFYLL